MGAVTTEAGPLGQHERPTTINSPGGKGDQSIGGGEGDDRMWIGSFSCTHPHACQQLSLRTRYHIYHTAGTFGLGEYDIVNNVGYEMS